MRRGLSIEITVPCAVAAGHGALPSDTAGREAFGLRQRRTVAAKRSSFPVRVSFHMRWKAPALVVMPW